MKVFLGGTCNGSDWRQKISAQLALETYDPRVEVWTEEAYRQELKERAESDFLLYVITPRLHGFYSIAEAVDDSNKHPGKTLFCLLDKDGGYRFSPHQKASLERVRQMVQENGAQVFDDLNDVVKYLNAQVPTPSYG